MLPAGLQPLLDRDPAAHAVLDIPAGVAHLLGALREAGAIDQVSMLLNHAAARARLDDLGFEQARELLDRQQLIAHAAAEGLHPWVLPG